MSTWEERKRNELAAKLASLGEDLAHWRERSVAGRDLEKHHSQVRRLTQDLEPMLERLRDDIAAADLVESWRSTERVLLDVQAIWGYFRDKLAVRLLDDYSPFLRTADDFAWSCYSPLQGAAIAAAAVERDDVREPPLVCLSDIASPFSLARGSSYAAELRARRLSAAASRTLARRLPVPVVAVPWFQLNHLPDALIIAYEVGHHVERDFSLGEETRAAVDAALRGMPRSAGASAPVWRGWCEEASCDAFGTLCAGPAFAMALADSLRVTGPPPADLHVAYPPMEVRLGICLAVLAESGCVTAAAALRDQWAREGMDLAPHEAAFATREVGRAMLTAPHRGLGGLTVGDVVSFGESQQQMAAVDAAELLSGRRAETKEIRVLIAAAGIAFGEDPQQYATANVEPAVLRRAHEIREPGVRWRGGSMRMAEQPASLRTALADELYPLLTSTGNDA